MSSKVEHPPLLPAGMHKMTVRELDALTVSQFPRSTKRPSLWAEFRKLLEEMTKLNLQCQIWVDGSFLTSKLEPDDIDFIVEIPSHLMENMNPAQDALVSILADKGLRAIGLHSFVIPSYPMGHKDFAVARAAHEYWKKSFGFSFVGRVPKGIAVVEGRI